ncbi:MAG: Ig-like domain-containing protein, partial [Clostridia bacterium]|nr:Ig-like domain-containing protein [Clostridia bacterium]
TVTAVSTTSVALDLTEATMISGLPGQNKLTLNATTEPESAGNGSLKWASSNPKVASVDNTGTVTAKSAGTATIRATTSSNQSATCEVTVTANRVVNRTPFTSEASAVYTSARRIFYKNNRTLVIEMYFANRTGSAATVPQAGTLTLMLADGRVLSVREVNAGNRRLKNGKQGYLTYQVTVEEGDDLYGLNLIGAAAEIVAEGAEPYQSVAVTQAADEEASDGIQDAIDDSVDMDVVDEYAYIPEDIDDAYIDDDSFIDDPFGSDDDWSDAMINTADYDLETEDVI